MRRTEARRKPVEAGVRIGGSLAIPAILRSLGADPAEVLAEAGVDLALFDDPENLISFAARGRLMAHCVARTGCRHFGLLVGQENGLRSLGLVGLLVRYSPDVGTALRSLIRYMHLHVRSAVTALAVDGGVASFSYDIVEPNVEAHDQTGDGAMAAYYNGLRELCGPDWKPLEVCFAHRMPADVGPYRRYFRVPLRFDAEQYALRFSAYWLNRRLPETDPDLLRLLQSQIDVLEARTGEALPDQLRRVLHAGIFTGHASTDDIARLLSMTSRSLNRRLNAFGTSFQELLDETRFEIARQMLEDSAMEAGQIAELLGYAAPGVFTRAFRRWSGTTPAQWRAAHKAPQ
jgi:AraC-like DNA-binding protein